MFEIELPSEKIVMKIDTIMETLYNFVVYESPDKYTTFSVKGKKKYDLMSDKLRKHEYWFTVNYTSV